MTDNVQFDIIVREINQIIDLLVQLVLLTALLVGLLDSSSLSSICVMVLVATVVFVVDPNRAALPKTQPASVTNQPQNQEKAIVTQEAQRWKAPEVVKAEEGQMSHEPAEQEVDPLRAAVFSLGLVLWEIETGSVPFAEQDATNAQRQLGTGAHPKMEGVGAKMQELIESCLALDPTERPKLSEVYSVLLTLGDDDAPDDKEPHSQP
ncbi:hypothetical protein BLNAU_12161 [Blattamonas nauphoetae]|uniref:Protein kinase domain-containing protein n=1 Tax=Blattamonas nauphoetae TaxID=2049346 RepID=A0ABQ9XRG9_9EUKA|nr:hypothetical protein BLNAU_12161 [Blattamonas nauphoetae]